jgi:hypothetical protein
MINENSKHRNQREHRFTQRSYLDKFHSVELSIKDLPYIYRFKLRDRSESGMCVLVQENSEVMRHLHPGDILNIKYCPSDISDPAVKLKTQIVHVTKTPKASPNGHFYVGLMVI